MTNKLNRRNYLQAHFDLIDAIRTYFKIRGFTDVLTPPLVQNPGMETHIHPFQVASAKDKNLKPLYLHTSPEFHMKELLSLGLEKIFTISYSFRDEPNSNLHRPQFVMLEWYRSNEHYHTIMQDCVELITHCRQRLKEKGHPISKSFDRVLLKKITVSEAFKKFLNYDILDYLDAASFRAKIQETTPDILPTDTLSWDDLFFLVFMNKIEPELKKEVAIFIDEYPHHLAALSKISEKDPRVCERFELYCQGVELANCFHELTDLEKQKARFTEQNTQKKNIYDYELPLPELLFKTLEKGLPHCSGIALGVDRLLQLILGREELFYDFK